MAVLPLESLPLGFRFHPTDEELVNHYLKGKINGRTSEIGVIPEVDVCKCEPWDLPDKSVIKTADPEWFFFSPRDRKYPNGHRSNRATEAGYWKATGKDRMIKSRAALIGMKKTLVFYRGRAPKGERSNWIMHEYRTSETDFDGATGDQGTYVLCRLFRKPEERSSNTDCDEMEGIGFSPTPARPSPGDTQHAAETIEEFENPLNQEISEPDMPEDPLLLPAIAEKQPDGIERWLADEADIGATFPIKSEENHCDSKLPLDVRDHDAKLVTKINPLPDTLKQFDKPQLEPIDLDGIPWIDSPYLPYSDYFRDIYDQGSHIGLFEELQGDFSEQDGFMDAVCNNQDEFFRAVSCDQIDSAASIVLAPAHNSSVNISTGLNESGIMIRSRQRLLPENSESLDQGMAIRRIHLQNKLSVGSFCSMGSESISGRDDHFENSSACDEKALPGMAIFTEEPKPVPRWRKQKKGFGGEQGGPLLQAEAAKAGSAPVYTVFAVLLVVLLVLCVGMVWGFKILWLCR